MGKFHPKTHTMSNVHIWVHVVWGTHCRRPYLQQPFREQIIRHIQENSQSKGILLNGINGYVDHLHCLVDLPREMTISKLVMLLKGESSFWVNKQGYTVQV
jgi:putative transposase